MEPKYYVEEVIGHPLLIIWEYDWMPRAKYPKQPFFIAQLDLMEDMEGHFTGFLGWLGPNLDS